jgi:hypothetical protein
MRTLATKSRGTPAIGQPAFKRTPEVRRILRGPQLQTKLNIGAVDDPAEHEADRVADEVMRMPAPDLAGAVDPPPAPSTPPGATTPPPVALGGGASLPPSQRGFFEPRFGRSFENVRIHTDARADAAASSIGALAFTFGRDIAFASGEYQPGVAEGQRLLAHELVHTVQQDQSGVPSTIQRFGAKTHEEVESHALRRGKKLSAVEARATYFGNWTRDFNQFLAPGLLTDLIGFDGAYALVGFMAAKKFGKPLSLAELGTYNPKEHIDNPGALYPGQDFYTATPLLTYPSMSPKGTAELSGTDVTPQPNINIEPDKNISGWTEAKGENGVGVGLLTVDQTGVMAYINDTNLHVERRLALAAQKGRTEEGFFHFGVALHAIEDLMAHSNFTEIALSTFLNDDKDGKHLLSSELKGKDRDVFKFMPSVEVQKQGQEKPESRPILTTGTFTPEDAKISLASEVMPLLDAFQLNSTQGVEWDAITEQAFINLLTALNGRPDVKAAIGKKVGRAVAAGLDTASLALAVEKFVKDNSLVEMYQNLENAVDKYLKYFGSILDLLSGKSFSRAYKMLRTMLIKKTLECIKELVESNVVDTQVAKTPLIEEKARLEKERAGQKSAYEKMHIEPDESTEDYRERVEKLEKEIKYTSKHLSMYGKREKQKTGGLLLSGPSHSQMAKDHPESIFFGIAAALAAEADMLLRDKLIGTWKNQVPLGSEAKNFTEKQLSVNELEKKGRSIVEAPDDATMDRNLARTRIQKAAQLKTLISILKAYANVTGMGQQPKTKIIAGFELLRERLLALDLYNYGEREQLYSDFIMNIEGLGKLLGPDDKRFSPEIKAAELMEFYDVAGFVAPAYYKKQKENITNAPSTDIVRSTVKLPAIDLSQQTPAVKELLKMSRSILCHPNDATWWRPVVLAYIKRSPKKVVTEIKLRNAGYVDTAQTKVGAAQEP